MEGVSLSYSPRHTNYLLPVESQPSHLFPFTKKYKKKKKRRREGLIKPGNSATHFWVCLESTREDYCVCMHLLVNDHETHVHASWCLLSDVCFWRSYVGQELMFNGMCARARGCVCVCGWQEQVQPVTWNLCEKRLGCWRGRGVFHPGAHVLLSTSWHEAQNYIIQTRTHALGSVHLIGRCWHFRLLELKLNFIDFFFLPH